MHKICLPDIFVPAGASVTTVVTAARTSVPTSGCWRTTAFLRRSPTGLTLARYIQYLGQVAGPAFITCSQDGYCNADKAEIGLKIKVSQD